MNFEDYTYDVPMGAFRLTVNDTVTTLDAYLRKLGLFVEDRDTHALVRTQCCVLPVTEPDEPAEFCVQLFNYQSVDNDPAILAITVTCLGTSMQVLGSGNEPLYSAHYGRAHLLKARRLQDVREERTGVRAEKVASHTEVTAKEANENAIMVIQVPLKQKPARVVATDSYMGFSMGGAIFGGPPAPLIPGAATSPAFGFNAGGAAQPTGAPSGFAFNSGGAVQPGASPAFGFPPMGGTTTVSFGGVAFSRGADMGVLSLGRDMGVFPKANIADLKRDPKFPVSITRQYYRVTDTGGLTDADLVDIKAQLTNVAGHATAEGSLVTGATPIAPPCELVGVDPVLLKGVPQEKRVTAPDLTHPCVAENPSKKLSGLWKDATMADF